MLFYDYFLIVSCYLIPVNWDCKTVGKQYRLVLGIFYCGIVNLITLKDVYFLIFMYLVSLIVSQSRRSSKMTQSTTWNFLYLDIWQQIGNSRCPNNYKILLIIMLSCTVHAYSCFINDGFLCLLMWSSFALFPVSCTMIMYSIRVY